LKKKDIQSAVAISANITKNSERADRRSRFIQFNMQQRGQTGVS